MSRVLVPIDHSPEPDSALDTIGTFVRAMNPYNPVIWLMHVGKIAPLTKHQHAVGLRNGEPLRAITTAATEQRIDLMPCQLQADTAFLMRCEEARPSGYSACLLPHARRAGLSRRPTSLMDCADLVRHSKSSGATSAMGSNPVCRRSPLSLEQRPDSGHRVRSTSYQTDISHM